MPVERRFLDRHVDNKNKIEVGNMQPGLMQNAPLLISGILTHAARAHGDREIVSRLVDEPLWRYDYAGLANRAAQAASMLRALGIGPGDCVSSLAWNTHRHYELFFAVPGIGAVLHTANPRLSDEQIVYTINHAGSQVLLFDSSFAACVARLRPRLSNIRHFIELAAQPSSGLEGVMGYEQLIAVEQPLAWPQFDENAGAVLCYTSGTTGDPKGVLYSHRSVVLHAMAAGLSGAFGLSAFDCIMPCSSLYHGTAWGPAVRCGDQWLQVRPAVRQDGRRQPAGADQERGRYPVRRRADHLDDVPRASGAQRRGFGQPGTAGDRRFRRTAGHGRDVPDQVWRGGLPAVGHDRDQPPGRGGDADPQAGRTRPAGHQRHHLVAPGAVAVRH